MSQWFLVCAWCKEWARKQNEVTWHSIKTIDAEHLKSASISHGICPACSEAFFKKDNVPPESDQVDQVNYIKIEI